MAKDHLLTTIRGDRDRFDGILTVVPLDRLEEPALPGGWSVKDVLAHISWGDREAIGMMRARALVGSDLWGLSQDERNDSVVRASRSQELATVLAEYRAAFDEYIAAIAELSDDDLNDPDRFAGLAEQIPGWRPWRVLYDPGHYAEHGQAIEAVFGEHPQRSP